ncbi:MAG: hypothetical protein ACO3VF_02660 [Tamlana sp.]|jgi:hypothetical protein
MMQNSDFLVPVLVVLAFSIIIFTAYYFSKKNIILRKLKRFKHKRISQFRANEPTKGSGKILQVTEPFVAPLSKRKYVAYILEVK